MIVCVPARFDPLAGRINHLHQRQADNEPPLSVPRPVTGDYADYLTKDVLAWITDRPCVLLRESARAGFSSRFFLKFENEEDAILFKLTWGGA